MYNSYTLVMTNGEIANGESLNRTRRYQSQFRDNYMLGLVLDKKDKADPDLNNTFKSKD